MDLTAKLMVSFLPVICETAILQELYIVIYGEKIGLKRRVLYGLFFVALMYPIVFLTDNNEFLKSLGVVRSILILMLYTFMLWSVFRGDYFARCLPAAAVFVFISITVESLMWFLAARIGLDTTTLRYTFWQILLFQIILFFAEFMIVMIIKSTRLLADYSQTSLKKRWMPLTGLLLVVVLFWIGFIQQLILQMNLGEYRVWDALALIACFLISLFVIKSSMEITREFEQQQRKNDAQKRELEYQRLYNGSMKAMLDEISRFRHNYNNLLASLKGYAEADDVQQLKEYITKICVSNNIAFSLNHDMLSRIKDGAVAGLIAAKIIKAEDCNVNFKLLASDSIESFHLNILELTEVLGILLDNAVEAAAASKDRYVKVEVTGSDDGVVIRVENSVDQKPDIHKMFQKGYTSKLSDSGTGLYILMEIIDSHDNAWLNTFADDERLTQELQIASLFYQHYNSSSLQNIHTD